MAFVAPGHKHNPFRLLLVEDNPADISLVKEVFRELDSNVHLLVAEDGDEAVRQIEDSLKNGSSLDLVLLDLNLPKMHGLEVLRHLKQKRETTRIPVLVMTSSESALDVHAAYESNANGYLVKPKGFGEFLEMAGAVENFWLRTARLPTRA